MNEDQKNPKNSDAAVDEPELATDETIEDLADGRDDGAAEDAAADDGARSESDDSGADAADGSAAAEEKQFLLDQLQRARAELDNFRRRTAEERLRLRQKAIADVFRDVSSCLDDLQMAVKSGGEEDPVARGVELTLTKFDRVMADFEVVAFGEPGEEFDPELHEAMLQVPSDDVEAGRIIDVFHRGYRVGDLLVRAARVTVAKPSGE